MLWRKVFNVLVTSALLMGAFLSSSATKETMAKPINLSTQTTGPWYVQVDGNDNNTCLSPGSANACATIQGAVDKASSGDTIFVADGSYTGTGTWVVSIGKDLIISGGWVNNFGSQNGSTKIDGEDSRRVFQISSNTNVELEKLTIANGSIWDSGGGIYYEGNSLTLRNIIVNGNRTSRVGGGIYSIGGSLTIIDSTISNNNGFGKGGGIYHGGTTLTIQNCLITNNESNPSGGWGGGIFIETGATLYLTQSIISENTAVSGGGIYNEGTANISRSTLNGNSQEAIRNNNGNVAIDNSTISENFHGLSAVTNFDGTLSLHSSTVTANRDGGIENSSAGTLTIKNSIVAGNVNGVVPQDCRGNIDSDGYNLIGVISRCSINLQTGDLVSSDPLLGPLVNDPGVPGYHPPLSNSPAIDAGDPAGCTDHLNHPLTIDQRGTLRDSLCDIGAVEYIVPGPAERIHAYSGTPQRTPPSFDFWLPLQAYVLADNGMLIEGVEVTFSAPTSGASASFEDSSTFTTTVKTNSKNGLAVTSSVFANDISGSYNVDAKIPGVVTGTNFLLSNEGWYVAPSGDNNNSCHHGNTPCKEIDAVLEKPDFSVGDTVLVSTGVFTPEVDSEDTIPVVLIDKTVRVIGGWDSTFTSQDGYSTIDGGNLHLGVEINDDDTVYLEGFNVVNSSGGLLNWGSNITIRDSIFDGNNKYFDGGGIFNFGVITVFDTTFRQNHSYGGGGAIKNGNGQFLEGILHLTNCNIIGNSGSSSGGIFNQNGTVIITDTVIVDNFNIAETPGGGINNAGGTVIGTRSFISNNIAEWGGGISNTGGILILNDSFVYGNIAYGTGGGIENSGGSVTLYNSSIFNNSAKGGGGIENSFDINSNFGGYLDLINSTVSGNLAYAGSGGGILNVWSMMSTYNSTISQNESVFDGGGICNTFTGGVYLKNSIIANNISAGEVSFCDGPFNSGGFNLIGDTGEFNYIPGTGDLLDYDPLILTFDPIQGVHPLSLISPAINAGNPAGCTGPNGELLTTDQRGEIRTERCDIGAYEVGDILFSFLPLIQR